MMIQILISKKFQTIKRNHPMTQRPPATTEQYPEQPACPEQVPSQGEIVHHHTQMPRLVLYTVGPPPHLSRGKISSRSRVIGQQSFIHAFVKDCLEFFTSLRRYFNMFKTFWQIFQQRTYLFSFLFPTFQFQFIIKYLVFFQFKLRRNHFL